MKENIIKTKTFEFAKKVVHICKELQIERKEFILSNQLLRSGTAPGALIKESEHAESKKDFIHKLNIALKEANEAEYWLELLKDGDYIKHEIFLDLRNDCIEIIRILVAIIKTSKTNIKD